MLERKRRKKNKQINPWLNANEIIMVETAKYSRSVLMLLIYKAITAIVARHACGFQKCWHKSVRFVCRFICSDNWRPEKQIKPHIFTSFQHKLLAAITIAKFKWSAQKNSHSFVSLFLTHTQKQWFKTTVPDAKQMWTFSKYNHTKQCAATALVQVFAVTCESQTKPILAIHTQNIKRKNRINFHLLCVCVCVLEFMNAFSLLAVASVSSCESAHFPVVYLEKSREYVCFTAQK